MGGLDPVYRELNRALRQQDPPRIAFWHPLLHPLLAGLRKLQPWRTFEGEEIVGVPN